MSVKAAGSLTIGLDIGIASVGWAVLTPKRIVALGVRAFDKAENEKGEPLNLARRQQRTARTRLERRALRLKRLRRTLRDAGLTPTADIEHFSLSSPAAARHTKDPWTLRAEGLDRKLESSEWARVLYHLIKHRGFYAARKSETLDENKEGGKLSKGVAATTALLKEKGYRTLGEMATKDEAFAQAKRNKAGDYKNSFARALLREELALLFERQRALGNPYAGEALHATADELFWTQKPALSGEAMLKLIGKCTFEREEYRAPKHSWSAERFVWLTRLNNLRIVHNGERRALTEAERQAVIDLPYKQTKLTYKQLRKALDKATGFPEEAGFAGLSYRRDAKKGPEEEKLVECKGWHELRKAFERAELESSWQRISQDAVLIDEIATALSVLKTDEEIKARLAQLPLSEAEVDALLTVSFSYFIQLSLKALRNILPHMQAGGRYDEACEKAGYRHYAPKEGSASRVLPPLSQSEVRNPVVFRSLNQARKVVNALVREYGLPVAVHIELGRDLSKSFEDRMEIRKGQKLYAEEKESAVKLFKETFDGREPSGRNQDLLKFRLYREQEGQCAYSQEPLEIERVLEIGYVEIDHVLPYSRSFDDSQNNKVLVLAKENREKGNRTPFEYLDGESEGERWRRFEAWVRGHKGLRRAKRERLLRKAFDERAAREFSERNLNDTRYATRYFSNFVRQNLRFAEGAGEQPVLTPSGAFTSFLRARWGLIKNRGQSDRHHALDAAVVAAASHALVKRVSDFHRRDELVQLSDGTFADRVTGEILSAEATAALGLHFPKPWENFRDELLARLSLDPKAEITVERFPQYSVDDLARLRPVWVSRAPKRRNGGALHQETIRSAKLIDKGLSYASVKLRDLKLTDLDDILGACRLDPHGNPVLDAEGKPVPDPRNASLIQLLRQRLQTHGGDGKKAFAEAVYKPSAPGKQAPLVRTVKLLSTQKGGVRVRGGIADQASMWRVDVFEKVGKFYLVPIYQSDRGKGAKLPNRAVTPGKNREEWELIEGDAFKFSVCLNDPVTLRQRKDAFTGYFAGLDISTGAIHIWAHDRDLAIGKDGLYRSLGVKTAHSFEKYHVDVLGNLYPARPEKRRGLA